MYRPLLLLLTLLFTHGAVEDFFGGTTNSLGVCYYPEQWPPSMMTTDAAAIKKSGISYVRIAEFMWSTIEPGPVEGVFNWTILDNAVAALANNGLKVVLGTPTATPPKWLVDKYPSILPYGDNGQPRLWGSRRHYSFSSPEYRDASVRVVTAMANRYGNHPAVAGWQLDNEYGCHNTIRTYDPNALPAYQAWLSAKYSTIEALNEAWGTVFWSMELTSFDQIPLPDLTVTEANPAARMDFYRFSSDQVLSYNQLQVDVLRAKSPGRFLTHNFMGWFFQFDSFALAQQLDGATWDNYPLGFTDTSLGLGEIFTNEEKIKYMRTGHPDLTSMHHSLYRAVGGGPGRFGVMEQQPGPVNWADHNPSPANGMVRLWSWEIFAHGGAITSYFRWRQSAFAQEQMHSGLFARDNSADLGYEEQQQVLSDMSQLAKALGSSDSNLPVLAPSPKVAIAFDYEAFWEAKIQPQGVSWSQAKVLFEVYGAVRDMGLDADFVFINSKQFSSSSLNWYELLLVPSLAFLSSEAVLALKAFRGTVIMMPRTGSKTSSFQLPAMLAPDTNQLCSELPLPLKVKRVESLRSDYSENVLFNGKQYPISLWKEWLEERPGKHISSVQAKFEMDGRTAVYSHGNVHYVGFFPSRTFLVDYISSLAVAKKLPIVHGLPATLRLTTAGGLTFAFNYADTAVDVTKYVHTIYGFVLGGNMVEAHGISAWEEVQATDA